MPSHFPLFQPLKVHRQCVVLFEVCFLICPVKFQGTIKNSPNSHIRNPLGMVYIIYVFSEFSIRDYTHVQVIPGVSIDILGNLKLEIGDSAWHALAPTHMHQFEMYIGGNVSTYLTFKGIERKKSGCEFRKHL